MLSYFIDASPIAGSAAVEHPLDYPVNEDLTEARWH
jgi:hypothetical protein